MRASTLTVLSGALISRSAAAASEAVAGGAITAQDDWRITAALIGAGASLLGTVVNIVITVCGWRRTKSEARRSERVKLALDKFASRIRTPIQTILNELCSGENALRASVSSAATGAARTKKIKKVLDAEYHKNYQRLTAQLRFGGKEEWIERLDAPWEAFLQAIGNLIAEQYDPVLIGKALLTAQNSIAALAKTVEEELSLAEQQVIVAAAAEG